MYMYMYVYTYTYTNMYMYMYRYMYMYMYISFLYMQMHIYIYIYIFAHTQNMELPDFIVFVVNGRMGAVSSTFLSDFSFEHVKFGGRKLQAAPRWRRCSGNTLVSGKYVREVLQPKKGMGWFHQQLGIIFSTNENWEITSKVLGF